MPPLGISSKGRARYVADVVEKALLLPGDMADLRSIRKHEVFLSLKRDLALAIQSAHRAEEIVNNSHRLMKDEEARRIVVVEAFKVAERKIQELTTKLTKVEREKKSAEVAMNGVEKQVEAQCKQLCQSKEKLATTKEQIKFLKKKLEEAEEVMNKTEKNGYEVGVAGTEEALRVEVSEVCRHYCLQVWNEGLNQARIEASSTLRKAENVYYSPAIRASSSSSSKDNIASKEVDANKDSPAKAPFASDSPSKGAG
ncbi:hypothetical protein SO802_017578 [Lithocarpus litseifolius]|uniref:Nuf2 DHR10-like domain-containing protein n=1 Tax=Lithocarpus litseifolius TaxID=425828 RepID=A0AAW2CLR4_9ROSI